MVTKTTYNVATCFTMARSTFEHDNSALITLSVTKQEKSTVQGKEVNHEVAITYSMIDGMLHLYKKYNDYSTAQHDYYDIYLYAENHNTEELTTYLLTEKNFK